MTHLEFDLESPIWRHLYRELAKDHTPVRYDARGNGLSDRTLDEISFDAFVSDLGDGGRRRGAHSVSPAGDLPGLLGLESVGDIKPRYRPPRALLPDTGLG
jgi:hypothetical protein